MGHAVHFDGERRLAPLDSLFLQLESEQTPMHMASIALFEGAPLRDAKGEVRLVELQELISSRLSLVPKLRQRPHAAALHEAPLIWTDDPCFDITDHVVLQQLSPPGTEAELLTLCGQVLAKPLPRNRPLWSLIFVDGLDDGRIALIEKLHHSMADGIAAAELATVLLDLSPEPCAPPESSPWRIGDPPRGLSGAASDLIRLAEIPLRCVAWGAWTTLHPVRRSRTLMTKAVAMMSVLRTGLIAPRSDLNARTSSGRETHFVRLNLEEIRDIAHAQDATVNDVVLTLVSQGFHSLMTKGGSVHPCAEVQALVPVGLHAGPGRGLGNHVSAFLVRLPAGTNDPVANLATIASASKEHKRQHQELAGDAALRLLEPAPQSLLGLLAKLLPYQPFFNVIVTNVAGPSVPLYALGAQMVEAFPIVPLVGNQGIGVAALSYLDQINLGILSDPALCPDAELFCEGVTTAFRVLRRSRGNPRPLANVPRGTSTGDHANQAST
jgi:diacylglycerol O-acyltransferase / wax synthase